jgi:hypothetical protein
MNAYTTISNPSTVRLVHNPRGPRVPGGAFPGWGPKLASL